ncbi:MAG: AmmeMemoRadiSam system protein A [Actinomycetota bacterium]
MGATSFEVRLAKETVEAYVRDCRIMDLPADIPSSSAAPRGVFVSIKEEGCLRGCIGTIEPQQESAAAEIIQNAISAAVGDPRFIPVTEDELDSLEYSVDILGLPEPIKSTAELDTAIYGLIVEARGRKGLLLPDIEGVDSVEEQLSICRRKAGLTPGEEVKMYRFTVTRYR